MSKRVISLREKGAMDIDLENLYLGINTPAVIVGSHGLRSPPVIETDQPSLFDDEIKEVSRDRKRTVLVNSSTIFSSQNLEESLRFNALKNGLLGNEVLEETELAVPPSIVVHPIVYNGQQPNRHDQLKSVPVHPNLKIGRMSHIPFGNGGSRMNTPSRQLKSTSVDSNTSFSSTLSRQSDLPSAVASMLERRSAIRAEVAKRKLAEETMKARRLNTSINHLNALAPEGFAPRSAGFRAPLDEKTHLRSSSFPDPDSISDDLILQMVLMCGIGNENERLDEIISSSGATLRNEERSSLPSQDKSNHWKEKVGYDRIPALLRAQVTGNPEFVQLGTKESQSLLRFPEYFYRHKVKGSSRFEGLDTTEKSDSASHKKGNLRKEIHPLEVPLNAIGVATHWGSVFDSIFSHVVLNLPRLVVEGALKGTADALKAGLAAAEGNQSVDSVAGSSGISLPIELCVGNYILESLQDTLADVDVVSLLRETVASRVNDLFDFSLNSSINHSSVDDHLHQETVIPNIADSEKVLESDIESRSQLSKSDIIGDNFINSADLDDDKLYASESWVEGSEDISR